MRSVLRGGLAWRAWPHAHPPWQPVRHSFRLWRRDGRWARLSAILCAATRGRLGRRAASDGGDFGQPERQDHGKRGPRGWDGAKQANGRTRQRLVDAAGLPLPVLVHPANIADRDGARAALVRARARHPTLTRGWADAGDAGARLAWAKQELNLVVTIAPPLGLDPGRPGASAAARGLHHRAAARGGGADLRRAGPPPPRAHR